MKTSDPLPKSSTVHLLKTVRWEKLGEFRVASVASNLLPGGFWARIASMNPTRDRLRPRETLHPFSRPFNGGRSAMLSLKMKKTGPFGPVNLYVSGRRDSNSRPSPWQGQSRGKHEFPRTGQKLEPGSRSWDSQVGEAILARFLPGRQVLTQLSDRLA